MAEVLVEYQTVMTAPDGRRFVPRACGRQAGHVWEGWIEFVSPDGSTPPLRTARETVQPNRDDLMYWAQGLSQVFLEGALVRAVGGAVRVEREVLRQARFEGPAPAVVTAVPADLRPTPVLDPFETFLQGKDVLVSQLHALDTGRLRDIVLAYGFADRVSADAAGREELEAMIMSGVQRPLVPPDYGATPGSADVSP
jgi:hypothetical protein